MSAYSNAVLADNPLLYLPLDEVSGAFCDNLGSTLTLGDGTCTGIYTRGVVAPHAFLGVGVDLGGATTDAITVPDEPSFELLGNFTYEAWIKPDAVNIYQTIISKGQNASPNTSAGYSFRVSNTARLEILKENQVLLATSTGSLIQAGVWQHVVVTRTTTDVYSFYINGVASGGGTNSTSINATDKALQIGRTANDIAGSYATPFNGAIDEVALYGAGLSAARVLAHYEAHDDASFSPQVIIYG